MTISNIRAALGACKANVAAKANSVAKTVESWGHACVRHIQSPASSEACAISMPMSGFDRQDSTRFARSYAVELHGPPF